MDVATALALGLGLGSVLNAPARKAIARVIGAAADRAVASLEAGTQAIRSEADAKSLVEKGLARQVASIASKDPALVERAFAAYLPERVREQENLEAIGAKVIEQVALDPPPADQTEDVSADFLNVFTDHAKRASSDELRTVFAKALTGEIRKPGSVSLSTLHVLSVMDKRLATSVKQVMGYAFPNSPVFPLWGPMAAGAPYSHVVRCIRAGLIDTGTTQRQPFSAMGYSTIRHKHGRIVLVLGEPGSFWFLHSASVTEIGAEIASLVEDDLECEPAVLDELLKGCAVAGATFECLLDEDIASRINQLTSEGRILPPPHKR